jgi:hypothetical protein
MLEVLEQGVGRQIRIEPNQNEIIEFESESLADTRAHCTLYLLFDSTSIGRLLAPSIHVQHCRFLPTLFLRCKLPPFAFH